MTKLASVTVLLMNHLAPSSKLLKTKDVEALYLQ